MFFDWWMIIIYSIVAGFWAEHRYSKAIREATIFYNNNLGKIMVEVYTAGAKYGAKETIKVLTDKNVIKSEEQLEDEKIVL